MKLIPNTTDLSNMDCHTHSYFSPDSQQSPEQLVAAVRSKGLRGFIITDHIDVGHWHGCKPIDFDEYFRVWNGIRDKNPDLTIYIGLEVGFEKTTFERSQEIIEKLPIEYLINSVHYWHSAAPNRYAQGKVIAYSEYIRAVIDSMDVPYEFNTIGHFGHLERYAPYNGDERKMSYGEFAPLMDELIEKAIKRGVRFEENTNAGGEMRLPRADFLKAYKAAGGVRPVISSDAHAPESVGQYFDKANAFLDEIF